MMRKIKYRIKQLFMYFYQVNLFKKSKLFDAEYYLSRNKDVADAGMSPIKHFLRYGAQERRNPSEQFDVAYYIRSNPDVRDSGINPLYHYIKYGRAEGRSPIDSAKTVVLSTSLSSSTLTSSDSATLILDHNLGGGTWEYTYNNLINGPDLNQDTKKMLSRYVTTDDSFSVEVYIKSKVVEKASYSDAFEFYEDLGKVNFSTIIVNNLVSWPSAGKVINWIAEYKEKNPFVQVVFKLHDYYSICPSYTLMDINERYCGVRCDEEECKNCIKTCSPMHVWCDMDTQKAFSITNWRHLWGGGLKRPWIRLMCFLHLRKTYFLKLILRLQARLDWFLTRLLRLTAIELQLLETC